jgi:hypothetical protein
MDWLRSEDLKEEKNVTAPIVIIAFSALCRCHNCRGVPLGMHRMNPECLEPDPLNCCDALLRQEPDEEDDEEEDDGKEDDDDTQNDEGYSE